jgi:hypothetical protein
MIMRKFAERAALIAMLAVGSLAIAGEDRAAQAQEQMKKTIERLDLTDEQIDRVKPILEDARASRQAIMGKYGVDPEGDAGSGKKLDMRQARAMRNELNAVQDGTNAELKKILSAEQFEEFKVIQQEVRDQVRERVRSAR